MKPDTPKLVVGLVGSDEAGPAVLVEFCKDKNRTCLEIKKPQVTTISKGTHMVFFVLHHIRVPRRNDEVMIVESGRIAKPDAQLFLRRFKKDNGFVFLLLNKEGIPLYSACLNKIGGMPRR